MSSIVGRLSGGAWLASIVFQEFEDKLLEGGSCTLAFVVGFKNPSLMISSSSLDDIFGFGS